MDALPRLHSRQLDVSMTAGVRHEEGHVVTADGLSLYSQRWLAEGTARGALLFVHGLGDHSGRNAPGPAAHFTARGFDCHAFDHRAHGRSPGPKVHVDAFDEFLTDLDAARRAVGDAAPGLPLFLVGHSQGGLVALRSALRSAEALAGVILSSPLLGIHPASQPSALLAASARVLSRAAPWLRLANKLDPRNLSHDAAVVAAYSRDPLVSHRVSSRWYVTLLEALADTHARASSLAVPMLVIAAGDDRVVDPAATALFVERAPRSLVTHVVWHGLYHEIFNEPEKAQVFRRMESWLEERLLAVRT
jgi:alpha-beta hydrolase superfamily lysophospholipase